MTNNVILESNSVTPTFLDNEKPEGPLLQLPLEIISNIGRLFLSRREYTAFSRTCTTVLNCLDEFKKNDVEKFRAEVEALHTLMLSIAPIYSLEINPLANSLNKSNFREVEENIAFEFYTILVFWIPDAMKKIPLLKQLKLDWFDLDDLLDRAREAQFYALSRFLYPLPLEFSEFQDQRCLEIGMRNMFAGKYL